MMDPIEQFEREKRERVDSNAKNEALSDSADNFLLESIRHSYSYNFEWLSRPIIQYPQDILAVQELIWQVRPDLIIETGRSRRIAHPGASMLALLDYCEAVGNRAIRSSLVVAGHRNRHRYPTAQSTAIGHPLAHKIDLIQGSSIERDCDRSSAGQRPQ
jgi:cephalosporin hydroxylase